MLAAPRSPAVLHTNSFSSHNTRLTSAPLPSHSKKAFCDPCSSGNKSTLGMPHSVSPAVVQPVPRLAIKPLPPLESLKGVLFDIDGTLTDSDPLHFAAFQEILTELDFQGGVPITKEFYNEHISGRHNPEIAADLFPQWTEAQHVAFYSDKEQRFRQRAGSVLEPMPGLVEFLRWVDERQLKKAAITNAPGDNARIMLDALGLSSYFQAIVLGEECVRAKPHPDPYLKALALLGLEPDDVIIVEDSPSGVAAGVAAGVPVVGITSGQTAERLRSAGASYIIKDWHELLALVPAAS